MKRFIVLLLVVVFLPVQAAHSQMAVFDAALDALLLESGIAQNIYYVQSMAELVKTAAQTVMMVENMVKQVEMQMNNLSNVGDVHGYSDFMDWYNRQLYLEKMTEDTFNNMSVSIGKKNYKITDIEGIAYGMKDTYVDYWDNEFTEEQNKAMWLGLGLTPSNYAYVQTWKEREKDLARKFLASPAVQNSRYMKNMIRNEEVLKRLIEDRTKPDNEKMGEKGTSAIIAEMSVHNNKTLEDISGQLADIQEWMAVEKYQDNTPSDEPPFSQWPENGFRPLKKEKK